MSPKEIDWTAAACRDEDPELFFPVGNEELGGPTANRAKAVCRRCPLAMQCLDWAMSSGTTEGIWGGYTPAERRALRRSGRPIRARSGV